MVSYHHNSFKKKPMIKIILVEEITLLVFEIVEIEIAYSIHQL